MKFEVDDRVSISSLSPLYNNNDEVGIVIEIHIGAFVLIHVKWNKYSNWYDADHLVLIKRWKKDKMKETELTPMLSDCSSMFM